MHHRRFNMAGFAVLAVLSVLSCTSSYQPSDHSNSSNQCKIKPSGTVNQTGNGNIDISPFFASGTAPQNVVGLRFKTRVHANQSSTLKIVFSSHRFWNPNSPSQTYSLESNLYSDRYSYTDDLCGAFPPAGTFFPQQSSLWMSVPDPGATGKVGAKTYDSSVFPRQDLLTDNTTGAHRIESISQTDLTGRDVTVEYTRGDVIGETTGWKTCNQSLDGDVYQQWISRITSNATGSQPAVDSRIDFALPQNRANYLDPTELMNLHTEFFADPGVFKAYFWDVEILREGAATWEPVTVWKLTRFDGPNTTTGYGVRLGTYQARSVIELSNDGPDTYLSALGQTLTLTAPPSNSTCN